jgi:hypothetical protein
MYSLSDQELRRSRSIVSDENVGIYFEVDLLLVCTLRLALFLLIRLTDRHKLVAIRLTRSLVPNRMFHVADLKRS